MAKSKNGGTRAYIRGRIGSDVYSVGKTSDGKKQQVVRSLAESVANPRTSSQMFGRMVMSTVMQAVSALKPIIDHSFDGLPTGQPSISEFIRQNYALIKADATDNPASDNIFSLNEYQEKGIKIGEYMVSKGSAVKPSAVMLSGETLVLRLSADTLTVGGLKSALGLTADGYITGVAIDVQNNALFTRIKVSTSLPDSTAITAENVASLFAIEGNNIVTPSLNSNMIAFALLDSPSSYAAGVIVSDKVNGSWIHNTCVLTKHGTALTPANDALPTYPVGVDQFLNGGDL